MFLKYDTNHLSKGANLGDAMSINDLIEKAKVTPVTTAQVVELQTRLEKEETEATQARKTSTLTKTFLSRTYSL
jgi:hypothetical protein